MLNALTKLELIAGLSMVRNPGGVVICQVCEVAFKN